MKKQALETSGLWKMQEMAYAISRMTRDAIGRIKGGHLIILWNVQWIKTLL
ncbi:MAG: hypothetical protein V8T23_07440 [Prevotella sp.]